MQLLKIRISGYRRFESSSSIVLEHRINAIVGRNESGKSSLLDALLDLNTAGRLDTRRHTRDSSEPLIVSARFHLDEADMVALRPVPEAGATRWLTVDRTLDGRSMTLDPLPQRDLSVLALAADALEASRDGGLLDELLQLENESSMEAMVERVTAEMRAGETNDAGVWHALASAIDETYPEDDQSDADPFQAAASRQAASLIRDAVDASLRDDPNETALRILAERIPTFLLFGDEDRDLRSEYQLLEQVAAGDEEDAGFVLTATKVPAALSNLARLAELDLGGLRDEIVSSNLDQAQTRIRRANRQLAGRLKEDWGQTSVECELQLNDVSLQILVHGEESDALFYIADRSAGLRTFIALQAFVAERAHPRPILLIDEVETHLHYDAQVDFIEVLVEQKSAGQVIYTTHSIGALPPDLISGLSAIVPIHGARSTIDGNVWSNGPELGLTPLLAGMGARLLAFVVPTEVVLTEGSSDSILFPRLVKAVVGTDASYRFAPGLSGTTEAVIRTIHTQTARFACVVDGDPAGDDLRKRLASWGVDAEAVVSVGDWTSGAITVEDLISADALAAGVNEHLRRWRDTVGAEMAIDSIPSTGKWGHVEAHCKALGTTAPSKPQLAQTILDLADEEPMAFLVDPRHISGVQALHNKLNSILSPGG